MTRLTLFVLLVSACRPGVPPQVPEGAAPAPKADGYRGIWVSLGQVLAAIRFEHEDFSDATHYVNHLLVSPDGAHFIFLHRWRPRPGSEAAERYRNTYLPGTGNAWILNDTYPSREDRKQTLYLFHEPTNRIVELGRFYEPPAYAGEWRVDLHPRASRSGTKVCIDSTHEGHGRQMYLVDVGDIIG